MVNILVGIDDSEYGVLAFQRALRLARPGEDSIFLLTVLGQKYAGGKGDKRSIWKSSSNQEIRTVEMREQIEIGSPPMSSVVHSKGLPGWHALENKRHFMKFASEKGTRCVNLTEYGNPRDVIPKVVDANAIDLVIMGSRGQGFARRALLGSTCDYCLKVLRVPILVVKKLEHMREYGLPYVPYAHRALPVAGPHITYG
jgi:nucleotide-binding universal stress UspA family protein